MAVLLSEVVCPGALLSPGQSSEVCVHADLSKQSGVSVTKAAVSISFSHVRRFDDVAVSFVSPLNKTFQFIRGNCFGAVGCGETPYLDFSFAIVPPSLKSGVPVSLCQSTGDYSAIDSAKLSQELSVSASALGRWSVQVSAGSQVLNVTRVSILFETSSLQVFIGQSAASSLYWTSDSSLTAAAPGFVSQPQQSGGGWGRNVTVAASSHIDSTCLFSYPDLIIHNTSSVIRSNSNTGSSSIALLGRYFANADSSARCRYMQTSSSLTRWSSDKSMTCHSACAAAEQRSLAVSMQSSSVAQSPMNLARIFAAPVFTASVSDSPIAAASGAALIRVLGASFGMWDTTLRLRFRPSGTAAGATAWAQGSAICVATKSSTSLRGV